MNRTLRFFCWKEERWRERAVAKVQKAQETGGEYFVSPEHAEGLKAYGARQASIFRALHDSCRSRWAHADSMIEMAKMEVRDPRLLFARLKRERARLLSRPVAASGLSAATQPPDPPK